MLVAIDGEADAAGDEVGGGDAWGDGEAEVVEVGGVGPEDEEVVGVGEIAEVEVAFEANGIDGALEGGVGCGQVGVAIEDDDRVGFEAWLHAAGLVGGEADGDEALASGAAGAVFGAEAGEEIGGDGDAFDDGRGADGAIVHGGCLRDKRNGVDEWAGSLSTRDGEEVSDTELERGEEAVEGGNTQSSLVAKEVGDVRRPHACFAREQGGREHLPFDSAVHFQSQLLVQLREIHRIGVAKELCGS